MGLIRDLIAGYAQSRAQEHKDKAERYTRQGDIYKYIIDDPKSKPEARAMAMSGLVDLLQTQAGKKGREAIPHVLQLINTQDQVRSRMQSLANQQGTNTDDPGAPGQGPVQLGPQETLPLGTGGQAGVTRSGAQVPKPSPFRPVLRTLAGIGRGIEGAGQAVTGGRDRLGEPPPFPEGLRGGWEMTREEEMARNEKEGKELGLTGEALTYYKVNGKLPGKYGEPTGMKFAPGMVKGSDRRVQNYYATHPEAGEFDPNESYKIVPDPDDPTNLSLAYPVGKAGGVESELTGRIKQAYLNNWESGKFKTKGEALRAAADQGRQYLQQQVDRGELAMEKGQVDLAVDRALAAMGGIDVGTTQPSGGGAPPPATPSGAPAPTAQPGGGPAPSAAPPNYFDLQSRAPQGAPPAQPQGPTFAQTQALAPVPETPGSYHRSAPSALPLPKAGEALSQNDADAVDDYIQANIVGVPGGSGMGGGKYIVLRRERAASILRNMLGMSGTELAAAFALKKDQAKALNTNVQMTSGLQTLQEKLIAFGTQLEAARSKVDSTGVPLIDKYWNAIQKGLGITPDLSALDVAVNAVTRTYASLLSNGYASTAMPHVGSEADAKQMLAGYMQQGQITAMVNQMKTEAAGEQKVYLGRQLDIFNEIKSPLGPPKVPGGDTGAGAGLPRASRPGQRPTQSIVDQYVEQYGRAGAVQALKDAGYGSGK